MELSNWIMAGAAVLTILGSIIAFVCVNVFFRLGNIEGILSGKLDGACKTIDTHTGQIADHEKRLTNAEANIRILSSEDVT